MPNENVPGLVMLGAGGHAKVIIDMLEKQGVSRVAFIVDDNPALVGTQLFGYLVTGMQSQLLELADAAGLKQAVIAIGNNGVRMRIAAWLESHGFSLATVIHPSAQIGRGARIGAGSVVMAGAVVNPDASIGENVIVNTGATVDHDCLVEDGVHIAPGSHLCGGVTIGTGTFLGAGSVVAPNVRIGRNVIVGAGSTVLRDVPDGVKIAGSPAKEIG